MVVEQAAWMGTRACRAWRTGGRVVTFQHVVLQSKHHPIDDSPRTVHVTNLAPPRAGSDNPPAAINKTPVDAERQRVLVFFLCSEKM
jgi:hypothetical protein